jgi:hypothetical protein
VRSAVSGDGPEEGEAAALAVDRVLPRRECEVAARAGAALPDREPDEFQAGEDAIAEMDLCLSELPVELTLSG